MTPRFSAAAGRLGALAGRRSSRWTAVAVVAAVALTIGALALTSGSTARIHVPPVSAEADRELTAAGLLDEAGLTGEFSFVLYDAVEDRYLLSHRPDQTHFTMSVVKILIAVGALEGGAEPSRIAEMISRSDDPIANEMWGLVGGPTVVERQTGVMGLQHTAPAADPGRWGDTLMSASDVVRMYEYVLTELPEADRAVILDAMAATTPLGSDGYDQTFGIPTAAADIDWAAKQGWGCCKPDRFLISTGILGPDHRYIAAIFGAFDETVVDEAASAAEMTAVASIIVEHVPDPA